jgi:hypothetical protein
MDSIIDRYFTSQCLSVKNDVYSFGVVLLEIIFGRKTIDRMLPNREAWNLCDWVSYNHVINYILNLNFSLNNYHKSHFQINNLIDIYTISEI